MLRRYRVQLEGEYRDDGNYFSYCEVTLYLDAPDAATAIKLARERARALPEYDCSRWWVHDIYRVPHPR